MFTLIFHVDDDICESYEGVVRFVEFVIPRIDSPELFDKPEVTVHHISTLVQLFVILPRLLAIALRRNHWTHPTLFRLFTTLITLIRLVQQQRFALADRLRNLLHQLLSLRIVCRRTRRQTTLDRQLDIRYDRMDFRRPTATTLADGLRSFFLDAPIPLG